MRFFVHRHRDKADAYIRALIDHGHLETDIRRLADFSLTDVDWDHFADGRPIFIYPHSVRSQIIWDGIMPARPVACNFAIGEGQKRVMEMYGYPYPVTVAGWPYSEIKPFRPTSGERVLFAPIHPRFSDVDAGMNRQAMAALMRLGLKITVRLGGHNIEAHGLKDFENARGVEYIHAVQTLASSIEQIEQFDLVIGHQTFAYLAVALGVPALAFGEWVPAHSGNLQALSWTKYVDFISYPLDLLAHGDPQDKINEAISSDARIQEWRRLFIGEPFDPCRFVASVNALAEPLNIQDAAIRHCSPRTPRNRDVNYPRVVPGTKRLTAILKTGE